MPVIRGKLGISFMETLSTGFKKAVKVFIPPSLRQQHNPIACLEIGGTQVFLEPEKTFVLGRKESALRKRRTDVRIDDPLIGSTHLRIFQDGNEQSGMSLVVVSNNRRVGIRAADGTLSTITADELDGKALTDGDTIILYLSGVKAGVRDTLEISFHTIKTDQRLLPAHQEEPGVALVHVPRPEIEVVRFSDYEVLQRELANGPIARRRARRELLERDTPEAWAVLLGNSRFLATISDPRAEQLFTRVLELASKGHSEARAYVQRRASNLFEDSFDRLYHNGSISLFLSALTSDNLIHLYSKVQLWSQGHGVPDQYSRIFGLHLMAIARNDLKAQDYIKSNRQTEGALASFVPFTGIVEFYSAEELIDLAEKQKISFNEYHPDEGDTLTWAMVGLTNNEDPLIRQRAVHWLEDALDLGINHSYAWRKEYIEHLTQTQTNILEMVVKALHPEEQLKLLGKITNYFPGSLGVSDTLLMPALKLAEASYPGAVETISVESPKWDSPYLTHLENQGLFWRLVQVISPQGVFELVDQTYHGDPASADRPLVRALTMAEAGDRKAILCINNRIDRLRQVCEQSGTGWNTISSRDARDYLRHLAESGLMARIEQLRGRQLDLPSFPHT